VTNHPEENVTNHPEGNVTQSNSGASAYLAFLTALTGKDMPLTADELADTTHQQKMESLLSGVDRSSAWVGARALADAWPIPMTTASSRRFAPTGASRPTRAC